MVSYTDEERTAALAEARETLERVAHLKPDPLAHYQRPREPEPQRNDRLTDAEAANLEARLVGMVASERAFVLEVVGEVLGQVRADITREIEEKIGLLRADVMVHRAIDKSENITELPNPLLRKTG
jgi:hypothetical protein